MGFLKPKTEYMPMPEAPAAPVPPPVLAPAASKPAKKSSQPSFLAAATLPSYGALSSDTRGKTLLGQ